MDRWTSRQEQSRQKERKHSQTPGNLPSCGLISASRVLRDEDGQFVLGFDREGNVRVLTNKPSSFNSTKGEAPVMDRHTGTQLREAHRLKSFLKALVSTRIQ